MQLLQFEVEAGDLAAVRSLEARRRDALSEPPPYDNAYTLLLKYRCDPNTPLTSSTVSALPWMNRPCSA